MTGEKRYCNKALSRGDEASKRLVTILPICNAWPDREAMGPSSKNNASLLRDKMEGTLTVTEKVS